ncbi:hypothetical protein NEMIN01_0497 [Nematocida minor]|uniref:uncharacterized protein n=1 Tax=Nematocida minor TaxID=1912983 RepID=UPI00222049C1|nr:uncharacterized protein NEMIN01_0497 [Nematocida minor]KAI5189434.1 hypothetical protein NEMIN01_0497 [Nematocida minor]
MILQGALLKKAIAMGAIALAYLQGAKCIPEDKEVVLGNLYKYWCNKTSSIEKQVEICSNFISKAESKSKKMSLDSNSYIEAAKNSMAEIENSFPSFKKNWKELEKLLNLLAEVNDYIKQRQENSNDKKETSFTDLMEAVPDDTMEISSDDREDTTPYGRLSVVFKINRIKTNELERILPEMLKSSTLIVEKICEFNSYMLDFIEKYDEKKGSSSKIEDLMLFKLARRNKMFPASIIFTFFEMEQPESTFDDEIDREQFDSTRDSLNSYADDGDIMLYTINVINSIQQKKMHQLAAADKHFQSMFGKYGLIDNEDKKVLKIYFNLSGSILSDKEIAKYACISPREVIKTILIEHLMDGSLINYKKNILFANLEKIILNNAPWKDEMINSLRMLWDDWHCDLRKEKLCPRTFCKWSKIHPFFFEKVKSSIMYSRWVYVLGKHSSSIPASSSREELAKELHFDMSYLHPMWYMCKQYERVAHLDKPDLELGDATFMGRIGNLILIVPLKISKGDDNFIRAMNMKSFMNTTFSSAPIKPTFEIICDPNEQNTLSKADKMVESVLQCFQLGF